MKTLKASKEFVEGKHSIGYVSSGFMGYFGKTSFESRSMPTFQKLETRMSDFEIEEKLKPGLCELGDILAFMENAPKECKDGNWNLFYTASCVVHVHWFGGEWFVRACDRGVSAWDAGRRVFSPANVRSGSSNSSLKSSDTLPSELKINGVTYRKV